MVGREVPLPGWLLNTASKTPDTHVAHQWGTARVGHDCRPEVTSDLPEHKSGDYCPKHATHNGLRTRLRPAGKNGWPRLWAWPDRSALSHWL